MAVIEEVGATNCCVVCGKAASQRCSSCAEKGVNFIWFCSREHQKLVWPQHKRVCGKGGERFRWPGFTEREAQMVKDIKHKPIPGGGRKSIVEHFRKTDKGFDISIDLLRDDRDNEREGTSAERRNDHIAVFRQLAYSARCRERDQTGPAAVGGDPIFHFAEEDPYGCCIAWQSDIWVGLANDYRDWSKKWQHLNIIHFAILSRVVNKTPKELSENGGELSKCFVHTGNALRTYCRTVITPAHPAKGPEIDRAIVTLMSRIGIAKGALDGDLPPLRVLG